MSDLYDAENVQPEADNQRNADEQDKEVTRYFVLATVHARALDELPLCGSNVFR